MIETQGTGLLLAVSNNPDPDKRECLLFGIDCKEKLPLIRNRNNLLYCCWGSPQASYLYEVTIDLNIKLK